MREPFPCWAVPVEDWPVMVSTYAVCALRSSGENIIECLTPRPLICSPPKATLKAGGIEEQRELMEVLLLAFFALVYGSDG